MEARPRSLKPVVSLLLIGGFVVGLCFWLPRTARQTGDFAAAGISNVPLPSPKPGLTRFSRVRRPIAAPIELPAPGTHDFAKALAVMLDREASIASRRQAAYDLVRIGTDDSLDALQAALPSLPPLVQVAAAEALGSSKHPLAPVLLLALWSQANEVTSRSIATALGRQGCADCLAALRAALLDPTRSISARGDAATGLGTTLDAGSLKLLESTFAASRETDLAPQILSAIAQRPFAETRGFFQQVLDAPDADPELRLAALESLQNLPATATDFLAKYLFDADADIRAEAAWALSATDEPGHAGPQILGLLVNETDPAVRLRLYQALSNQTGFDVNGALHVAQAEPDGSARLAAYQALAGIEGERATPELRAFLDQKAVPTLRMQAVQGADLSERLQAVMILQQVNSAASRQALETLRQTATEDAVQRALRGVE
jgi:HEAT repeat protein